MVSTGQNSSALVPAVQAIQPNFIAQPDLVSQRQTVLGPEQSALIVAEALTKDKKPDINALMTKASLSEVKDEFCQSEDVYNVIVLDRQVSKKACKAPFTYVELTCQGILPGRQNFDSRAR